MNVLINFVLFQVGWFSSVLGAANNLPWAGPVVVAIVVGVHLLRAERASDEFALVMLCAACGAVFDSLLVISGWVAYPSGMFLNFAAPYWIVAMWLSFATTLNCSLAWMKGRPALTAGLGLVSGPLTYLGGQKLGGIEFVNAPAAMIALAVGWAAMLPLIVKLAERFDGITVKDMLPEGQSAG